MGVVFGWCYRRWGRVMPLVIAHTLLDIVAFVGYPLAAALWPGLFAPRAGPTPTPTPSPDARRVARRATRPQLPPLPRDCNGWRDRGVHPRSRPAVAVSRSGRRCGGRTSAVPAQREACRGRPQSP